MNTPIYDFVKKYASENAVRLHMPGHKGQGFFGIEKFDITETDGADTLYHSTGIIRESEENAASLFGTARTVYSTEGTSLSIRAMIYLAVLYAKEHGKKAVIAAGRNAHRSFISAAALTGITIHWIYPDDYSNILECVFSADSLERELSAMQNPPAALYITSPDYLGNIADIKAISKVCRRHGILLLVDNAHGAYLGFLPQSRHPIALGADIVCDSAHKTLPVLTGGAYLHFSKNAPSEITQRAENAAALFASTSPSYLILQSLDLANAYLASKYPRELSDYLPLAEGFKSALLDAGYVLTGDEPLKVTVCTKKYGYYGFEIADILKKKGFICEFYDRDHTVMMLTPKIGKKELKSLEKALLSIEKKEETVEPPPVFSPPEAVLSPRESILSESCEIPLCEACGRVLAELSVSCPPAVPPVVSGERLSEDTIALLKYYGIGKCRVIK